MWYRLFLDERSLEKFVNPDYFLLLPLDFARVAKLVDAHA